MCSSPHDNREGSQVRAVLINPADQQTEKKDRQRDRLTDRQTDSEGGGGKHTWISDPLYRLDLFVLAILKQITALIRPQQLFS